jgi:adenosylcobinamide kinase/adenosylcobinamide-phosphate guanylyltransferase
MTKLTLVLGGARSGKSSFAQKIAQDRGGDRVVYVATAEAGDEEMRERIQKHRRSRPSNWRTLEIPCDVGAAILTQAKDAPVVLLDCLTLLISNLLVEADGPFAAEIETQITGEVDALVVCAKTLAGDLIIVSNEVGMGLVPPYPLGRAFRDIVGRANQDLARNADEVYLLVAGIPMVLKGAQAAASYDHL